MSGDNEAVKTAIEIGADASRLSITNQSYVLNTINALLFSQQSVETSDTQPGEWDIDEGKGKGL